MCLVISIVTSFLAIIVELIDVEILSRQFYHVQLKVVEKIQVENFDEKFVFFLLTFFLWIDIVPENAGFSLEKLNNLIYN
ncbi:hypothetical protein BpHYR1_024425 [Brachionus plicatilis]|uniref:Uncharacterized protein n=1 Tax=Brachionus plicatilis TaxID=10195 RepID=A0A3M7QTZ3_BRAPC|nr:hypothetical protein BpHYR1_024425 [Brachionus plicatilis]